ncbi:bifunctional ornithine acetyltransferase/N-acetylglutamate synthase [Alloscardovia macacae]|uniref:Arginine biosynthesis bifunctional protein ArgJ n=1 Tax=Alloscardovia macacae TaxID=1160091 RepID=A0A1Y2SWP1_9BIFI|nr:bifunctional glutamate N-acetyltransferase/amino-acid acetyltransferase ArgJ [Alloscardovia macacae]OTA26181.1 bifunctional ornithine acetyltransferase/N-acetylglutamate synthase [Alloscardovia macacae]OTA29968.1 bifunctional ornithine acetyltransferase/N-acetylglutamate synthase [Alloscardovia macacae]
MSVVYAQGFSTAGVRGGISSVPGKKDVALVVNEGPLFVAAGVFTTNRFAAAPVQYSREVVASGHAKAMVINSGGANACTGEAGLAQVYETAAHAASVLGSDFASEDVLVASTGLIGELLPLDAVFAGVTKAAGALASDAAAGQAAAEAIMTTDTKPKTVTLDGMGYRMGGMVKGSGMIAPQLATMISVITTDAVVSSELAQEALKAGTSTSFDCIDVDGCMSTNDTVILLASGASGVEPDVDEFKALVAQACASLARQIIGDGEGSSHDIRVRVTGAESYEAALACGRAVSASNLLKCAIYGNDPNWGRVVSSLGTVPEDVAAFDPNNVTVDINGIRVCDGGKPGQSRELVSMAEREVHIDIDLGTSGTAEATVWTDDLTLDYVHINADYES